MLCLVDALPILLSRCAPTRDTGRTRPAMRATAHIAFRSFLICNKSLALFRLLLAPPRFVGIPLRALRACSFYPPAAPCALFSDKRQASQCSQETRDEESHFAFISFHIIFIGSILAQHWGCREAKLPQTLRYGRSPLPGPWLKPPPASWKWRWQSG